ncbi:MAG: 30S ribosomal protein S4 [Candidatus Campbellbacteria bacterium]|nr:30S ribosomal protein S4 [Candidatus Campbellbacteria bacterium]
MLKPKKFKIARRLGPAVYEQAQTERFALSEARKKKAAPKDKHRKNISAFNVALKEKQRVRFHYGISERQFARYVKESMAKKGNPVALLFARLEQRLDNVVYRIGLAPTHRAARQMVSHGHIAIAGKRMRVPSHQVSEGTVFSVREGSQTSKLFSKEGDEKTSTATMPNWISLDEKKKEWKIVGIPSLELLQPGFNLNAVIEFYSR